MLLRVALMMEWTYALLDVGIFTLLAHPSADKQDASLGVA
jgi:hypothetical protein